MKVGFDQFEVRVQRLLLEEAPEQQISVIVHLIGKAK
jgi:hypothetical protein